MTLFLFLSRGTFTLQKLLISIKFQSLTLFLIIYKEPIMTTMLEVTKEELNKVQALTPTLHPLITSITNAITHYSVPHKMKSVIAVHHIIAFAAQFNRKIELWDQTQVPINGISFVICGSGVGKDSSHRAAYRCFEPGYELISKSLEAIARKRAIAAADNDGQDCPDDYEVYKKYLNPIPPFETAVTTGPGLIKLLNDAARHDTLATSIYSGEVGDLLTYSADIADNLTILAETYDLGIKEVKYTKGEEHRSAAVSGSSLSALLMGSPVMLYDDSVKYRFQTAFMSKLARRSFFCFELEELPPPDFTECDNPAKAEIDNERKLQTQAAHARFAMKDGVINITNYNLPKHGKSITVSDEVFEYYTLYKRYNTEVVTNSTNRESTSALIRRHLQWKALKLAGAFAIMDMSDTIELHHYVAATQFCESLSFDMEIFERELNKSYYERFSDYCHTLTLNDSKAVVDVHDIKKRGFLANVSKQKLQEMINLAASYDKEGIYSIVGEGAAIQYEPIIRTDVIGISFKPIDNTALNLAVESGNPDTIRDAKHTISVSTAYGYEVADTTFPELADLLAGDFAYSPFKFRNGVRGKDNIISGTKYIVLDVDDSVLTASEAHFMLSDINHHIALSSDPNNEYKFRILIELDSVVDLSPIAWKHFYLAIAEDLALKVDPLPQSQIFFSYAGRPVLSNLDASPLPVRDYIMIANEKAAIKEIAKQVTPAQSKALLADPLNTFSYSFESPMGSGSRNMIRAAYHARDLGATREQTLQLINDINEYWEYPMEPTRLDKLLDQVSRMF